MKRKIYIDFDNTLINTITAICDIYNIDFRKCKGFKPANWYEVYRWDFSDQCPLMTVNELCLYFENPKLFEIMGFMDTTKRL